MSDIKKLKIKKGLYDCYLITANQTNPKAKVCEIRGDLIWQTFGLFYLIDSCMAIELSLVSFPLDLKPISHINLPRQEMPKCEKISSASCNDEILDSEVTVS